jgi:very-short-patch-repair endonuclease
MNNRLTQKEVKEYFEKYGYEVLTRYENAKTKLTIRDEDGFKYQTNYGNFMSGKNPLKYSISNKYTIFNIALFIFKEEPKTQLLTENYVNNKEKLKLKCKCGNIFYVSLTNLLGQGRRYPKVMCNECSLIEKGLRSRVGIGEIKRAFGKLGYEIDENSYTMAEEPVTCFDKQGYKGRIVYKQVKKGSKFQNFSCRNPYAIENIHNYIKLNNIECKLLTECFVDSKQKLKFQCKCGEIFYCNIIDFRHRINFTCEKCYPRRSSLERKTIEILDNMKISYISEYSIKRIRKNKADSWMRFDFYLDELNIMIEVDGAQHFTAYSNWDREEGLKECQQRDKEKNEYCKKNNIPLLRVDYKQFRTNKYRKTILKFINSYME